MIITNNNNLPAPFVKMAEDHYEIKPKRYSVTTLLKPVREILLNRRYNDVIEQDCSDMIWMLFGQATHAILEKYTVGKTEFAEEKLEYTFDSGYTVSGVIDLYDMEKAEVVDYKTASVWKVIKRDFDDWRKQGLMYAWLLRKNGLPCDDITFYAILKDHSIGKAKREAGYPQSNIFKYAFPVTDAAIAEIDKFIRDKLDDIIEYEDKSDDELPLCSEEDRWNDGDKYAVMKKGRKTALRVLDSEEEAELYKQNNGGDYIEKRPGEDKKCNDYCRCCTKCGYWQSTHKEETDAL
ncbi:MAG: hypothetical protein J1G01_04430 [Clostridiales bacterium]|nr:hypothetical protein [Clostridiales bacterium]